VFLEERVRPRGQVRQAPALTFCHLDAWVQILDPDIEVEVDSLTLRGIEAARHPRLDHAR
jgi:hypothetical protein